MDGFGDDDGVTSYECAAAAEGAASAGLGSAEAAASTSEGRTSRYSSCQGSENRVSGGSPTEDPSSAGWDSGITSTGTTSRGT